MHPSEKMEVNRQLNSLSKAIDEAFETLDKMAETHGYKSTEMLYTDGHLMIAPLLLAKAEVLSAKVQLNTKV